MDSRLERLQQALNSALEGMSDDQLRWHPEGKWCALEVLEHLYLTYAGTVKGFQKMLQGGKPLATRPTPNHWLRKFVVLGLNYLPGGRKSPAMVQPKGLPSEKVRQELAAAIKAMDTIITDCELHFGSATPLLDHPILGALTGRQWKKFHWLHGMHHQKQLLRLRERQSQNL
jgi:Protein of unknown function (DUF1569)